MSKDNNGIKVNVLYDFEAQEEDELDLKAGDVITVFKQVNDAWWMAKVDGKVGIVPTNYIEFIEEPTPVERNPRISTHLNQGVDVIQLSEWLATIKMERYSTLFLENGYDNLEVLEELSYENFDEIGITDENDKRIIISASMKMRSELLSPKMRTREIDHELEIREYPDDQTDNFDSSAIYGLEEDDDPYEIRSPRKCGYLSKKGSFNKGWKRRWVIFEDNEMKYFKSSQDKEPSGIIKLHEISKVQHNEIESKKDPRYGFCFDIITNRDSRVFLFCCDKQSDLQSWLDFLDSVSLKSNDEIKERKFSEPEIQILLKPPMPLSPTEQPLQKRKASHDFSNGKRASEIPNGFFEPPDKEGWLKKMGNNVAKDWKRRYVVLKGQRIFYYRSYEHYISMDPINFIEVLTTSVKPVLVPGKHRFQLITLTRSFWFQAESQIEMMEWILAIQDAIGKALTTIQSMKAQVQIANGKKGSTSEKTPLETLLEIPSNKFCAECSTQEVEWSASNKGIVLCIECSGIHRSLGVQISKVKSLCLDDWPSELISMMKSIGNDRSNKIWEASIGSNFKKILPTDDREIKKDFIVAKYVDKLFLDKEYQEFDSQTLSKKLFDNVKTKNIEETIKLVASSSNINYVEPTSGFSILHSAAEGGIIEQIEFLLQNGANPLHLDLNGNRADQVAKNHDHTDAYKLLETITSKLLITLAEEVPDDEEEKIEYRCGYMFERGGLGKFWRRRWFIFEEEALRSFKLKEDKEPTGVIMIGDMTNISIKNDPQGSKPHYFEISTCYGRVYELSAENEIQLLDWHQILTVAMNAKNLKLSFSPGRLNLASCDMHGFLNKKTQTQTNYRSRWFIFKEKNLYYFKNDEDRDLLGCIDLRLLTEISLFTGDETKRTFIVKVPTRTYYLEATTPLECTKWMESIKSIQVFGVPLHILSSRKQGSHDKGVPLIVVKCVSYLTSKALKCKYLYKEKGDENQTQQLKIQFDRDDLSVTLATFENETDLYSIAQLLLLFFKELPDSLFPSEFYDEIVQTGKLKERKQFFEEGTQLLRKFPDVNLRTIRKLMFHLEQVVQQSEVNLMTRDELSSIFSSYLIRKPNSNPDETFPESDLSSIQYFIEQLMINSSFIFKEVLPDVAPRKPIRPKVSVFLTSSIPESQTLSKIDVLMDNGPQRFQIPVGEKTTVKEVCYSLVKKAVLSNGNNLCTNYSLFEVSNEHERPLDDDEQVISIPKSWNDSINCSFVFKNDPLRSIYLTMRDTFPEIKGWLHKEGVSVKSWKKRFFILRIDGLYYYKDTKNLMYEVGIIPFQDFVVCNIFAHKRCPTKFCFSIRSKNYLKNLKSQTPQENMCRILATETRFERENWMAAINRAKTFLAANPQFNPKLIDTRPPSLTNQTQSSQ